MSVLDLAADLTKGCALAARKDRRKGMVGGTWRRPIVSEALAVHPEQIPEVLERNKRHGINCHYDGEGRPVLESRGQRRKLMKLEGHYDRRGGYSDA